MKIRTSENSHDFQGKLFRALGAYSLQGLLMNDRHEFTAAVEAVEYEAGDDRKKLPFTESEMYARYILAKQAGIPLYVLCYMDQQYKVYSVYDAGGCPRLRRAEVLDESGFIQWWAERKQTTQHKKLNNGGESRLRETVFDNVLRKNGYEWGGNIDGFVLTEDLKGVKYIIDNISVSRPGLKDEPSHYFTSSNPKHGPRYEGWYGAVKLANQINVPHALFTIDKCDEHQEHIGFTVIKRLTPQGIYFVDDITPDKNIISGMGKIIQAVSSKMAEASPPELEEKND